MDVLCVALGGLALLGGGLAIHFYLAKEKAEIRLAAALEQRAETARLQAEMTQAAKASALSAGNELASKLLDDHKRETESARKNGEQFIQKTTGHYHEQLLEVVKQIEALRASDHKQDTRLATLWRALSTPAGAGQLTEINLENMLKNLGLEPGRDFIMQYAMKNADGARLKPDCVVFLPQGRVMVLDCKASKFLVERAEAETPEAHAAAVANLRRTMQEHVKALVSRDYRAAIQAEYAAAGRAETMGHVFSVMYLSTESALSWLREADKDLPQRAEKDGIIIAGPASLYGLLSLASLQLTEARKEANREQLVEAAEALVDALAMAFTHVERAGKSLGAAAEHFGKFTGSANQFVLPRIRKLLHHGAKPAKAGTIPARLPVYEVRTAEEVPTLEGEFEDASAGGPSLIKY